MRVIFFGSGAFGLPTLAALAKAHDVALVVTQPDRPAGRKRRLTPTPIAQWAEQRGMSLIKPHNANREETVAAVADVHAEANVVVAFGQKVGQPLINSPKLGPVATMNLHASLLPKYRGAAPINWAIIQGERETGNTVFALVEKMDAGDILGQERTPIDPRETAGELHDRLAEMGPRLVLDVLAALEAGTLQPRPQDESLKTLAPKLSRKDGWVDFQASAQAVRARVHGLTPWPGVEVRYQQPGAEEQEGRPLLLRRVEVVESRTAEAGDMIEPGLIATGDAAVRLLEVQPPGKRTMSWQQFQAGHELPPGTRFK